MENKETLKPRVGKRALDELKDKLSGKNKPVELTLTQKFKEQLKKLIGRKND